MRGWLVALGLCGCSAFAPKSAFDDGAERLVSHDATRIGNLLYDSIELGGVWFADPVCRRFSGVGRVDYPDQPQLARCLASLQLARGKRRTSLLNGATVVYPPGIELEAVFTEQQYHANWSIDLTSNVWLGWLGFAGRESVQDALPTVTQELMESHRRGGSAVDRAALDRELAAHHLSAVYAWLKVCIDAAGAITSVRPRLTNSVAAQQAFVAAAGSWTFAPIVLGGQPAPVCAMMLSAYPRAPDVPLPFVVPPGATDLPLVSVEALGPPQGGELRHTADWQSTFTSTGALACIAVTGAVDRVTIVRRSGSPKFDATVRRTLQGWVFAPQPPVCVATMLRACGVGDATHACTPSDGTLRLR